MKWLVSFLMVLLVAGGVVGIANADIPTAPISPFSSYSKVLVGYDSTGKMTALQTDSAGRIVLCPSSVPDVSIGDINVDTSKVTPELLKSISSLTASVESVLAKSDSRLWTGDSTLSAMHITQGNLKALLDQLYAFNRNIDSTGKFMAPYIRQADSLLATINTRVSTSFIDECAVLDDTFSVGGGLRHYSTVWSAGDYDQKTIFIKKNGGIPAGNAADSLYILGSMNNTIPYFGKNGATETWGYLIGANQYTMIVLPVCHMPYLWAYFKNGDATNVIQVSIEACGKSNHRDE